jgi:hypothetical protein
VSTVAAAATVPRAGAGREREYAALVALFGLVIGLAASPFSYDDAWISHRYAYNLAAGEGFVYNPGERVLGTTAPGYALLVGLIALPSPASVPQIGGVIGAFALAAAGVALFLFGSRHGSSLAGAVAALVFVVNPLALDSFGGEMLPQAALVLWGMLAVAIGRPMLATILGAGAAAIRPDGVIALALLVGWIGWRERRIPLREAAVAALSLAAWFGGLWLYFGTPLPQTMAAKQAQRASGMWNPLGTDLVIWVLSLTDYPTRFRVRTEAGFTAFLALALAGLPLLGWRRRWWPLAAWPIALMLAYRWIRVPFYHWYAVPPLALLAASAGVAAEGATGAAAALVRRATRLRAEPARVAGVASVAAVAIVGLLVVAPMARRALATRQWFPGPGERAYIAIGDWLARTTPPDASVGYIEVGFIGYHARRRLVDPFGLVTPGVAPAVAKRDLLYAYRERRPDFILFHPAQFPDSLGRLPEQPWFQAEYAPVATLAGARGEPITVYRRGAPRPAPPR